ncbi:MAG: nitroreductase family protein [Planctomycetes bacterium]|nr:nitroreductase family protein [Planctomycetota bacterium]
MDFLELVRTRRSIRAFKPDSIEDEKLNRILEAARLAPTAANRQPIYFVVVKDKKTKQALKNAYNQEWFYTAPVIICACCVPKQAWVRNDGKNYCEVDVTIAMDHLILGAWAEGLGTCWIAAFKPSVVKDALKLPEGVEPIALTPLGYPKTVPSPTHRKAISDVLKIIG